ncbi:formin-like protein 4 [Andrographis paniculata]|uniref:formin-like protein 4 n=1 Tax=Andrographis paniculata TaxID=175694 RepID=UPI0021E72399|nr:formin-like protein 4 [Andrographis paniculata]
MAANTILLFLICLILSRIPKFFCQWKSPQNIQTFYPFSTPPVIVPPPPAPPTPFIDPPEIPQPVPFPPPPRSKSSSGAAVGRAIGATAASTVVVSALLFFLLLRRARRKRERENGAAAHGGAASAAAAASAPRAQTDDDFHRFGGNLRGLIVDEDGLDVLYWRSLQNDGGERRSFKKQNYRSLKDEQRREIKRMASDKNKENSNNPPPSEAPLLRGMSSSSQSPSWSQKQNPAIAPKAPSNSPAISVKVELQQQNSSPAVVEAIPAPPPPAPPPPPLTHKTSPPPPPQPKPKTSLPPPPQKTAANNSIEEGSSSSSSNGSGQVKLKPLHWDKVNTNLQHSMVWDKIDKGSFRFDGDLMEALFGYVATNKKSPRSESKNLGQDKPQSQIFILDTRKSQNTAIVLKSLGVGRQEIVDALIDGHGLSSESLEKLTRITPTDEEISQILAFNGDPTKLADAESFLYSLLNAVPSAFPRFNAMLFRLNHDMEISSIKESLQSLESACNELRTRGLFLKLLEAVLKAGNRLNAGTARGNAQAFNLTALTKLSDVKSSDGKTTLLQFVVQEVVRAEGRRCLLNRNRSLSRTSSSHGSNAASQITDQPEGEREYMILGLPVIGGLSAEFSNVKKAASLDYDLLTKTSSLLVSQLAKIRETLKHCGGDRGFAHEMASFLDAAESEMKTMKEEQRRVMEVVKKTTDYYQAGASKGSSSNPLQLFVIVRDFLQMVDQVCVDIARNVQKRKPAAPESGSTSTGSPRVFRFPKLPANFMSDDSRSSLDDDEGSGGR